MVVPAGTTRLLAAVLIGTEISVQEVPPFVELYQNISSSVTVGNTPVPIAVFALVIDTTIVFDVAVSFTELSDTARN